MGKNSKRRPKWAITSPRHKQGLTARARRVKMEVKMPDDGDEMVEVEVKVEHSTGKAWLVIDTMTNNEGWHRNLDAILSATSIRMATQY